MKKPTNEEAHELANTLRRGIASLDQIKHRENDVCWVDECHHITPETIALTLSKGAGKSEYVAAGDLDQGVPNHTDHSKREFTPK